MRQQTLFDSEPLPWEEDAASTGLVASVVFPGGPAGQFDYRVPDSLANTSDERRRVEPGRRLRVPLGKSNRSVIAYCVGAEHQSTRGRRLKSIETVLDARRLLSPAMLRLTQWISDRYLCHWGQVLDAVVPAGVRGLAGTRSATVLSLPDELISKLPTLDLPEKQAAALRVLATCHDPMTPAQLARRAGCTLAPIQALRKKGLVVERKERMLAEPQDESPVAPPTPLSLNLHQRQALDVILAALRAPRHETILLHGVTGSGKTEVYLRAIEEAVSYGRQAIVLVPEISLTPQTVERFRARFRRVAVLHSHQSDAVRHWHWQGIARGEVEVVVGARSAVFAPTPNLGVIVLDEEHEASFKQDSTPRYHAREVARERAESEGIPLVLGSATPALETWQRAQRKEYRLVSLPHRVEGRALPQARIVDLRQPDGGRVGALSRVLHQEMEVALREGGQVLLLLNRRGFSTHIQCPACGHVVRCANCDLALTFHRREEQLRCHHCDHLEAPPKACCECGFKGIRFAGLGTQKLEDEVRQRFPDHRVIRMDTDSTRHAGSHAAILEHFRRGEARILLGTQMIAKGLDFPNVTLVGVVNADTALHFPDFRSGERTFQLLTQVAGRAGRGAAGGRVVVQTFSPDHAIIQAASHHDYISFVGPELALREALGYPPFASLARIVARSTASEQAAAFAESIAERLRAAAARVPETVRILGPAPAPLARLRGMFRYHLHIHADEDGQLRSVIQEALASSTPPEGVYCTVDIDPQDML
jgi:primosomal protein N' (replication factor Y)